MIDEQYIDEVLNENEFFEDIEHFKKKREEDNDDERERD